MAGSPFTTGIGTSPASVTVSPNGAFAFVANKGSDTISAYSIAPGTGALTPVAGSPFIAGPSPYSVTVSPNGAFIYVANSNSMGSDGVSAYSIAANTGVLTPVAGSPFATGGASPNSVTVSPNGAFAYVANSESNSVSAFTINAGTGVLTPVAGSPFTTGAAPFSVTVSPNGAFVYVANWISSNVSAYSITAGTGILTPVADSPFLTGSFPYSVTVTPDLAPAPVPAVISIPTLSPTGFILLALMLIVAVAAQRRRFF
ncbi:IPTL-CTERM sorting domain-containing protein [Candidatus Nitrotoga sp. HW29]|uniref:IPTL-CTERM sorting domain-containing protein n=1 Tax=Candidatus Nitrotoga sp. HW29 TaxID=2886963 RepID=UPI001EF32612|nr:IPTL-CTERM sorting domain-containing protein [Candidatus Nitrotoga sp. HW29]